jgi:hypothetical protein
VAGDQVEQDAPGAPFEVVVTREGNAWLATVPALEGSSTWAESLDELRVAAREVIVLGAGLPRDVDPHVQFRFDRDDDLGPSES